MTSFFSTYPKVIINNKLVTDIIARSGIREKYSDKLSLYYPYNVQEGDTPEIIASKYYGDPERHWIVMFANEIINPFFDFTLDNQIFDNYINKKYADKANSLNQWAASTWRGEWSKNSYIISEDWESHHGGWNRSSDWLTLPSVAGLQKFVGLYGISPGITDSNHVAFSVTTSSGLYQVDWGDGTIETFFSGETAQHIFNYATFDLAHQTLITHNNILYKQTIISVTPVTGNLTGINLNKKYSGIIENYDTYWLDIAINGEHITAFTLGSSLLHVYFPLLESIYIGQLNQSNFSYIFNSAITLSKVYFYNLNSISSTIKSLFYGMQTQNTDNYTIIYDIEDSNIIYVFNKTTKIGYFEGSAEDDDRIYKYFAANTVMISNTAYICTTEHTPTIFTEDLAKNYWNRIYEGVEWKGNWGNHTYYNTSDVVQENDKIYIALQNHTSNSDIGLIVSNSDYWKTYNNALEYSAITTYGYRANITTTDEESDISTTETIYIDSRSFNGGELGYSDPIFNYASQTIHKDNITVSTSKERISIYEYEMEANENKREIKLIRKEYVPQLENELKILMETYYG